MSEQPTVSEGRPTLLRNISWLGFASALVKPIWFVFITAACMRLLGVGEFGVMSAALSLGMIATAFIDLGMIQYITREVAREPSHASRFFTNFLSLRLGNAVVAWIGALVAALLLGYGSGALAAVAFATIYTLTLSITNLCRAVYRAFEDLRQEAIMLIVEKVLVIGAGFVLLYWTRTASWTLSGMAAGMSIATVANAWWIHRTYAPLRPRLLSASFLRRSVRVMVPFGLAGLFTVMYYRVDIVMLEAILGEVPTGQYGAAYRILEALQLLPTMVALAAVYPRMARLYHEGQFARFHRLLQKSAAGLVAAGVLISAAIALLAEPIIALLAPDPSYGPAAGALRIVVWSFPFLCANFTLYSALISMDQQRFASIVLGMAVLVNVGFNAILIPRLGINGAAIATIIPEVLLAGIYAARYRYVRKVQPNASV